MTFFPVNKETADDSALGYQGDHRAGASYRADWLGLWRVVMARGQCTGSDLDPDAWFPVSAGRTGVQREAAAALAICAACPVRADCLELALRNRRLGEHGVWGGTLPAERDALRRTLAGQLAASSGTSTS
jgi:WhiB family redox-sensing transcriptional regulator